MTKYDLEERLITFSVSIINLSNLIVKTKAGNHLSGQIIRSGTSVALNYGEAQSSESKKDFIHKFKIILKELRETLISLKIIEQSNLIKNTSLIEEAKDECGQLISIFVKSIETAQKNN
ncbi:MAG: four helix bundle protein [Ignavibacteriae bacterium]|nr:four helix bundle protein [Ignavibacteriota bacterium]NOG99382.1 four helix bundle protein [Ignavibacteriota bacterium]